MTKHAGTEALFKQGNYKFRYVEKLLFSDIDLKASEENPARLRRKIDDLLVNEYGLAMLEGAPFPAIVVFAVDQAKYLVGTGMHRIKATKDCKLDWHDAYIVTEPDQYRQELLLRLLNGIEGKRDTRQDVTHHIFSMHEKFPNTTIPELAKMFHIPAATALSAWNEYQGIKRASKLGFDFDNGNQPQNTIIALNKIGSDIVYQKAAELPHYYNVTGRMVENMVRDVNAVKTKGQDAEMAVVKKYHDQAEEEQRRIKSRVGKTSSTMGTKFIGGCRGLSRQASKGVEHLHLSALVNPRDSLNAILDLKDHLNKVQAELERIIRMQGGSASSGLAQAASPIC
jgi:hypothetical protein